MFVIQANRLNKDNVKLHEVPELTLHCSCTKGIYIMNSEVKFVSYVHLKFNTFCV